MFYRYDLKYEWFLDDQAQDSSEEGGGEESPDAAMAEADDIILLSARIKHSTCCTVMFTWTIPTDGNLDRTTFKTGVAGELLSHPLGFRLSCATVIDFLAIFEDHQLLQCCIASEASGTTRRRNRRCRWCQNVNQDGIEFNRKLLIFARYAMFDFFLILMCIFTCN